MGILGRWVGLWLLVVAGCRTAPPELQPPPPPPDYSLPPENDGRFNKPYQPTRDPFSSPPDRRSVQPLQPMIPARAPRTGYGPGAY